jgi:hypothetical protein
MSGKLSNIPISLPHYIVAATRLEEASLAPGI